MGKKINVSSDILCKIACNKNVCSHLSHVRILLIFYNKLHISTFIFQLKVREHPLLGPFVEGLSSHSVESFEDVEVTMRTAQQ